MSVAQGWIAATLAEVTTKIGSGSTPKGGQQSYAVTGVPLIRSMNVHFDGVRSDGIVYLSAQQAAALDNVRVREGDVLLNITGASIGRVAIAPPQFDGARVNQHVSIIRTALGVEPRYVSAFLASPNMQAEIGSENYGVTRPALTKAQIEKVVLPLPPLAEQRRIVAKLDVLTARTARARADLDRVPALAERQRRAVLSAAFRGELSAHWRAANTSFALEPTAHEIARRTAWEKLRGRAKYQQPAATAWTPSIDLPTEWRWASVDELTYAAQYGTSSKTSDEGDIPVLRMGNIVDGQLDMERLKFLPASHPEFPDLLLEDGDLLFNRTNSPELVGKTAVYRGASASTSFASYLIRLKAVGFIPELLAAYINSPWGREWVANSTTQQVGQANVNGTKLKGLAVPLMSDGEQAFIWSKIKAAFAEIDRVVAEAAAARRLLDRLDQAILAKAFRGELVPQDPADEPASALLERIRAERTAGAAAKPGRGRRTKAA